MTRQEKIREGVAEQFYGGHCEPESRKSYEWYCAVDNAAQTLSYLHSQGVVIKVEGEYTSDFICDDYMDGLGWLTEHGRVPTYRELDRFIRALGYEAVEPLIGEAK